VIVAAVTVVRAAGGLLWRSDPAGPRVAIVHRPRRNDWSLPKGKLADGEGWEQAAIREVEEETGCAARITGFAGVTSYFGRRAPKLVLYWHMALVRDGKLDAGDEIDEVAWLAPADAVARLDYEVDRRLLSRVAPPGSPASPGAHGAAPASPGSALVAAARADLLRRVLQLGPRSEGSGLGPALELLDLADRAAAPSEKRTLVLSARRLALLSVEGPERSVHAHALREEARHLAPWRRRAIRRVLSAGERVTPEALYLAAALRDEEAEGERRSGEERAGLLAAGALAAAAALSLASVAASPVPGSAVLVGGAAGVLGGAIVVAAVAATSLFRRRRGR
jgi:8-oxo-dGTP diphosphatase